MNLPNLHQKGNRLYYVKQDAGKRLWIKVGTTDDEQAAIEIYRRLYAADKAGIAGTLDAMFAQFRGLLQAPQNPLGLADRTRAGYLRQLELNAPLRRVFGPSLPQNVRPVDIVQYLDKRGSPIAANREIALLSRIYAYHIERGADLVNPCTGIRRNRENSRRRYVQDWEFGVVRQVMAPAVQIAMDISYLTGLRLGDVLRIAINHYDEHFLRVSEGKTGTRARIVMTDTLKATLGQESTLPGSRRNFRHVVRNRAGRPYTLDGFESLWQRGMRKALSSGKLSERFTFHDLRAKHATDKDEEALNAQLALGHADPATTKKYIRHALGRKIKPLGKLPDSVDEV